MVNQCVMEQLRLDHVLVSCKDIVRYIGLATKETVKCMMYRSEESKLQGFSYEIRELPLTALSSTAYSGLSVSFTVYIHIKHGVDLFVTPLSFIM